jgi:two-component sensor histidine kinase
MDIETGQQIPISWARCRDRGLTHNSLQGQGIPDSRMLRDLFEKNRIILHSSAEIVDGLAQSLEGIDYCVGISGREGLLLYYNASDYFRKCSRELNIFAGSDWSEQKMGTNPIGTALECTQPVILDKEDHYFGRLKEMTGAGIPIRSKGGHAIGTLFVLLRCSLPAELYGKLSASAKTIESRTFQEPQYASWDQHLFFSEIVHESRNFLTACEGFLQFMLVKREFNPQYVEIVLSELNRAISILSSYGLISSPGRCIAAVDLNKCIGDICLLLSSKLDSHNISLSLSLDNVPNIIADSSKIKQVILNMMENSIDAIGNDGKISIETNCEGGRVMMAVSDSGCGVDSSLREKIFMPFFTTKPEGTGLGLHVCRLIAESFGGSLELDSSIPHGTRFILKFKAAEKRK